MSEDLPVESTATPQPFDQEWYDRFEQHGSFAAYEYLDGKAAYRQEERRKFEAGEVQNPTLDYPKLNPDDLSHKEEELRKLKHDVITASTDGAPHAEKMEVVKQVYRWRLNEKLAEVGLMKAAAEGDTRRFKRYSEFIYGQPSPEVFAYTVDSLRTKFSSHLTAEDPVLRQAAEDFLAVLPTNLPTSTTTSLPDPDTIAYSKAATIAELGHIINVPESDGELDATAIHQAFTSALDALRSEGWKVVIDPNKQSVSVNQEQQQVLVPADRRMKPDKLKGLILHEIGTHVNRRNSGERSQLRLLGLGLDRYEGGEEGVATVRQQAAEEKVDDFAGLIGHMAISFAQGLDGTPRDFRQTYEIMYKYQLLQQLTEGAEATKAQSEAKKKAWDSCVRTFRGSDCKTPGAVFTKDIIYREGNMGVWDLVRSNPEEMKRFSVGKYDPTNPRHLWVLTQLGITDNDLTSIEK